MEPAMSFHQVIALPARRFMIDMPLQNDLFRPIRQPLKTPNRLSTFPSSMYANKSPTLRQ